MEPPGTQKTRRGETQNHGKVKHTSYMEDVGDMEQECFNKCFRQCKSTMRYANAMEKAAAIERSSLLVKTTSVEHHLRAAKDDVHQ